MHHGYDKMNVFFVPFFCFSISVSLSHFLLLHLSLIHTYSLFLSLSFSLSIYLSHPNFIFHSVYLLACLSIGLSANIYTCMCVREGVCVCVWEGRCVCVCEGKGVCVCVWGKVCVCVGGCNMQTVTMSQHPKQPSFYKSTCKQFYFQQRI